MTAAATCRATGNSSGYGGGGRSSTGNDGTDIEEGERAERGARQTTAKASTRGGFQNEEMSQAVRDCLEKYADLR